MVGSAGYITGSKHPILGTILHFTPSNIDSAYGYLHDKRTIEKLWVLRIKNCTPIAGRSYDSRQREYLDAVDGGWLSAASRMKKFRPNERRYRLSIQKSTQYGDRDRKSSHSRATSSKSPASKRSSDVWIEVPVSVSSKTINPRDPQHLEYPDGDTTQKAHGLGLSLGQASTPTSQIYDSRTEAADEKPEDRSSAPGDLHKHEDKGAVSDALVIASNTGPKPNETRQHEIDFAQAKDATSMPPPGPKQAVREKVELAMIKSHQDLTKIRRKVN